MRNKNTLILFTKTPQICRVKTRLWPHLNHRECLRLHRSLIQNIVKQLSNQRKYNFILYATDNKLKNPLLRLTSKKQYGCDLGQRMLNALNNELKRSRNVVLIGSDCVEFSQTYIGNAFNQLEAGHDIVLGPTNDGGYCLVGMKKPNKFLFENIAWSTPDVMQESLRAASKKNKNIHLLERMNDIDTIDDLKELQKLNALPNWVRQFI